MMRAARMVLPATVVSLLVTLAFSAPVFSSEDSPALSDVPALSDGFRQLYEQKFPEARAQFSSWAAEHPEEPFGQIAIGASFLFEEFYRQGVLTSDFFLNDKKFLKGIDGKPDAGRMKGFQDALTQARTLSRARLEKDSQDADALFCLTMADGMESDADSILQKKNLDSLKRMKEANEYAQKLLALRPDAKDAYVAVGAANYIIGSLSGAKKFFLWFGGIHGDRQLGMQQLQKTADGGRYLRPFAKILLALAARREKQPALAERLLRELNDEFPASPLFAAEYAKIMGRPIPATIEPN
jgi:hypothetical protein